MCLKMTALMQSGQLSKLHSSLRLESQSMSYKVSEYILGLRRIYLANQHYIHLLLVYLLLFLWRSSEIFSINFISSHIGNFVITGLVILLVLGPSIYSSRNHISKFIFVCFLMVFVNIVMELFINYGDVTIPFVMVTISQINVADKLDIPFGLLSIAFLAGDYYRFWKNKQVQ